MNMDFKLKEILEKRKRIDWYMLAVPLSIMLALLVFAAFTGIWPTSANPYNSYALQADSWLQGRLDLGRDYPYLELAIFEGKYFVSFPPFPSYILLPFAKFMGTATPDHMIVWVVTLVGSMFAYKLCCNLLHRKKSEVAYFFTIFLFLGNNTLFFITNGWVWFFAQSISFSLMIISLYAAERGCPGWSLFLWACAVGCRPFQAIYLPVLIWLLIRAWKKKDSEICLVTKIKKDWYKLIPCGLIAISYCALNYARFGSITEFGHNYLPEFTRTTTGQFNISYFAENLKKMFRLPGFNEETKQFTFYLADGIAFYLVSPLFLVLIIALIYRIVKKRDKDMWLCVLITVTAIVHILILCMHKTLGGWHFGNRYTCDALPAVLVGVLLAVPGKSKILLIAKPLFVLGFALNIVGTIAAYNHWI